MRNYLSEILKRKDLLLYLVQSGLKAEHRNSYLGYFWWLLDPLLNVVVYYFLIVVILQRGSEDYNYAVYLVIGLVSWRWTSTTVNTSAKAITKYSSIINQVYLPKSIFPLSFTLTQLFNFAFGLVVVALFLAIFGVMPGWQIVYLPVIILTQLVFLMAIGLFLAYVTVFVRDIDNVLNHVVRVFFYASPIIWQGSRLPEEWNWVVAINPIAILVNAYRDVLMFHSTPPLVGLFVVAASSMVVALAVLRYYSRNEHKIIKAL